jgi:hypothetical protein
MAILFEIVGWVGAALLLAAYILLSLGRLRGASFVYQMMNLVGAAGLAANGFWNGAFPSVALNVIWMAMGIVALVRLPRTAASSDARH